MSKLTLKIILTVILSLPTAFFLMFLFGEVFAGVGISPEERGGQHEWFFSYSSSFTIYNRHRSGLEMAKNKKEI